MRLLLPKYACGITIVTFISLGLLYVFLFGCSSLSTNANDWVVFFSFIAIIPTLELAFFTYRATINVQSAVDKSAEKSQMLTMQIETVRQINALFSQCVFWRFSAIGSANTTRIIKFLKFIYHYVFFLYRARTCRFRSGGVWSGCPYQPLCTPLFARAYPYWRQCADR